MSVSAEDTYQLTTTLLLERLHNSHDAGAWKLFDARFRGVIVATGLRLGLSPTDAEDAAQDTMLQAVRDYQAGKYDRSRGRLSSWIIGIAHHRIVDVRRKKRPGALPEEPMEDRTPGSLEDVSRAFEQALERRIFEQAWEHVRVEGGAQAQTIMAFELTAMRGVPAAQAAAECGMSVDQVYVARNRIAKKLRETVDRFDRVVRDGL